MSNVTLLVSAHCAETIEKLLRAEARKERDSAHSWKQAAVAGWDTGQRMRAHTERALLLEVYAETVMNQCPR